MNINKLFIAENKFKHIFKSQTPTSTFANFKNTVNVKLGNGKIILLKNYKTVEDHILKILYEFIIHQDEYMLRLYNTSIKLPEDFSMKGETPMKIKELNNNNHLAYKNIIRNMHYIHILEKTKSGIKGLPTFFDVLRDLVTKNTIDYKIITPSSQFYIKTGKMASVLSSLYFRSSIMNPFLVYSLNTRYLHATRVFTPTLGWTSYMYGFLESGVVEYVGTDVIPSVCEKTALFGRQFYPDCKIDIHCCPSEDLLRDAAFMRKYRGYFDTIFFSPPYYDMETYEGKQQSVNRYHSYEEWLDKYWERTMYLCSLLISNRGKMAYIISNYGDFSLVRDMNTVAQQYFKLIRTENMYNKNVNVTTHRETGEKIFIFNKI
jgi:hypothetical protein